MGLRTVLYAVVAAVGMLVLNLEVIARSEAPGTGALVMLVLLLVGAFVVATIQTASEERPAEETAWEGGTEPTS
ncbi:hypothetical protein [Salinibacter ruber]|nr:hypothetical protein [Salinibacter ruber]MBB4070687.1 xanthosine utilization system XapX-like protein [Salinibacter ruber]MCS3658648.1 xanthosine utilization system XapX-like protein [Salinibacter ruber]